MYLGQNIKQILPGNVAVGGANMGMVPLFSVQWCPSRDAIWAGYVAADGQELDDNLFPDAAAGISANNVPTTSNANWLADPTARGAYVAGSSAGKFRVPDYNGKFAGSLGAVFLRGDGTLSAAIAGVIQQDAIRAHNHKNGIGTVAPAVDPWVYGGTGEDLPGSATSYVGETSGSPARQGYTSMTGGAETRPLNVTGCWVIKLFGAVTNMASADAAQLASSYASLTSRLNSLDSQIDFTIIYPNGGSAASPANVNANSRYVLPNPFQGHAVICVAEVLFSGAWADPGWSNAATTPVAYGTRASHLTSGAEDSVIVQTGVDSVSVNSSLSGGGHIGITTPLALPCRVKVWKVKGAIV